MPRVTIYLTDKERTALTVLATEEYRGLREHIRYILSQEIQRQVLTDGQRKRLRDNQVTQSSNTEAPVEA